MNCLFFLVMLKYIDYLEVIFCLKWFKFVYENYEMKIFVVVNLKEVLLRKVYFMIVVFVLIY